MLNLSKNLKQQLIKESPSLLTLQRSLFDKYENFKSKVRINKFQVEDLYIKRETGLPIDLLEEIERDNDLDNMRSQSIQGNHKLSKALESALSLNKLSSANVSPKRPFYNKN